MKLLKTIALFAALLALCAPAQAEAADWYEQTARELASAVVELSCDEGYLSAMGAEEVAEDFIAPLQAADFGAPSACLRAELPVDWLTAAAGVQSDAARERLSASMSSALVLSGAAGAEQLAASSALSFSRCYAEPEGFSPCVLALQSGEATLCVSFARAGEQIVEAQAVPVFGESAEALIERLSEALNFASLLAQAESAD